jgi:hypothetical protein
MHTRVRAIIETSIAAQIQSHTYHLPCVTSNEWKREVQYGHVHTLANNEGLPTLQVTVILTSQAEGRERFGRDSDAIHVTPMTC